MPRFAKDSISLNYPEGWTAEEQADGEDWTVTFQSPGSAFALLSLRDEQADPDELADLALEAMKAEYPSLEDEPAVERIAGQRAFGYDIDFFALDFPVHCRLRWLYTPAGALMLLSQSPDPERAEADEAFRLMTESLRVGAERE